MYIHVYILWCLAVLHIHVYIFYIQIQTDMELPVSLQADVECQTAFPPIPLPSPRQGPTHLLNRTCAGQPGLNDSLCIHRQESNQAQEKIEMVQKRNIHNYTCTMYVYMCI